MKKIFPEFSFTEQELNILKNLEKETALCQGTLRILYARGIDTKEKIERFMHPSRKNFLSPFLMKGMKEAVELLSKAKAEQKTVAVFGDYDADGVCASAIMYFALKRYGIDAHIYVPERQDGYGLSMEAVDKIFDEIQPELFITVDCGISCKKEAQYIYELGADVIVTDHHELPEELPDCVVVNPKLEQEYPYDNLCGAGVAFKLATALIGEDAFDLIDFATLATVADSVPLLGENRDIVAEGLKKFNHDIRPCFSMLLNKTTSEITAQTLSFSLAPKVNAAGRMGSVRSAFDLFVSEDEAEIYELSTKLCAFNLERQKCCDELYLSAKRQIIEKGAYGNIIMLSDDSWNAGFIGIVAARIAEEYNRPALLFVKNGELLKGSARSIENVNIYKALKNCSEYITEFGGHSQAAGVNIEEKNFPLLERALDEEVGRMIESVGRDKRLPVAEEITEAFDPVFADELQLLEPYGVGFKKPLFVVNCERMQTREIKPLSPHLSIKCPYLEMTYFSGIKDKKLLESNLKKQIVFDVSVSVFKGKKYVKGTVKDVLYEFSDGADLKSGVFEDKLLSLKTEPVNVETEYLSESEIKTFIEEKMKECPFGLCMLAESEDTLRAFKESFGVLPDLFYPSSKNVLNTLLLYPQQDADLSGYRDVVFLDTPSNIGISSLGEKRVYVNRDRIGYFELKKIDTEREKLLNVYCLLKDKALALFGSTAEEIYASGQFVAVGKEQFIFALRLFEELGLVKFEENRLKVYRGMKVDLNDSVLYKKATELKSEIK